MRHRWSIPILLALAALAGYTLTTKPVRAQGEPFPFQVGDTITFSFQGGGATRSCRIEEMKGAFARCGNTDRQGPTVGRRVSIVPNDVDATGGILSRQLKLFDEVPHGRDMCKK